MEIQNREDKTDSPLGDMSNENESNRESKLTMKEKFEKTDANLKNFQYMEHLLNNDVETLTSKLNIERESFYRLIEDNDITDDFFILCIKILHKISKSTNDIAKEILCCAFSKNLIERLREFIATLPIKTEIFTNKYFSKDFWTNLCDICDVIFNRKSNFAGDYLLPLLDAMVIYIPILEKFGISEIDTIMKEISGRHKRVNDYYLKSIKNNQQSIEDKEPPNYFRSIDVYPTSEELLKECFFLRRNIVRGPFKDVSHYLDIHFRLLREDFIAPLRSGIMNYIKNNRKVVGKEQIRLHEKTCFLQKKFGNEHFCYQVQLKDQNNLENYVQSKRFLHGSLLCFTNDFFQNIHFGRVFSTKDNKLIVSFDNNINVAYNIDYLMIEYDVFFEPYYNVLKVLKSIYTFPMERYIINVESQVHKIKSTTDLQLSDYAEDFKITFNHSQQVAFSAAVTHDFTLIQGPPGTGKTFVGLEIVKYFLRTTHNFPILIICYTNHALDQFLEGLLPFTTKLLRVGGQSKSKDLKIYVRSQRYFMSSKDYKQFSQKLEICRRAMHQKKCRLISFLEAIEELEEKELVNPHKLSQFCHWTETKFIEWLIEEEDIFKNHEQKECGISKNDVDNCIKAIIKARMNERENFLKNIDEKKLEYAKVSDIITAEDRWQFYFYAVEEYKKNIRKNIDHYEILYQQDKKNYECLTNQLNIARLQKAKIIGMTTTCAARFRSTLEAIQSPIVIVEEAAEVLESHIIAALTPGCQQLILIGDHQQLKPSTADFKVERHYQLGISLFERMVLNNIHCYTLGVQHRMRPEIASLITPNIYPNLKNHQSVYNREPITGIEKSVFFIDHEHAEVELDNESSKKNIYEVKYLVALAKYLVLNGYEPAKITVIAAYLAQMFAFKEHIRRESVLKGINVVTLDNYQGEENYIILLSLVRNNVENSSGFLKIENRINVALSRARNGLYIMGNMKILSSTSKVWCKIRDSLENMQAIGPGLQVRCQNHINTLRIIQNLDDFSKIPDGGCDQKCNDILECGHKCTLFCHIQDHSFYKCLADCERYPCKIDESHKCQRKCFEDCGCCTYKVSRTLPCGHTAEMLCYKNPKTYKCQVLNSTILNCGHLHNRPCYKKTQNIQCQIYHRRRIYNDSFYNISYPLYCQEKCTKYYKNCTTKIDSHICQKLCYEECPNCEIIVEKIRMKCSHKLQVPCYLDVERVDCNILILQILECGHKSLKICSEPLKRCEKIVEKIQPTCGHKLKTKCSEDACTKECKVLIDWNLIALCGHQIKQIPCYKRRIGNVSSDLVQYCKEPCREMLKCGHLCEGTCGECLQGCSHKRCSQKCGAINICSHFCGYLCGEICRPCDLQCTYSCDHSKCGTKCGEPCIPCPEPCERNCQHKKCTAKCGDICTVPPCMEPCDLNLACGHNCVGFCGDPCPPCRICDKSNTYELFFGTENDDDAKFIVLNDCKHVIESSAMEAWIQQDQLSIGFKTCPKCKTVIKTTKRLTDYLKESYQDVIKVKVKLLGTHQENIIYLARIESKFSNVLPKLEILEGKLKQELENIYRRFLITKKKTIPINKIELSAIDSKIRILDEIAKIKFPSSSSINIDRELEIIISILNRETDFITQQEVIDVEKQLLRLSKLAEYYTIRENVNFTHSLESKRREADNLISTIEKHLLKLGPYEKNDDKYVKEKLEQLNTMFGTGLSISDKERQGILKAMDFSKGHWYKCSNGHVYAIADCSGAINTVCDDCNIAISQEDDESDN